MQTNIELVAGIIDHIDDHLHEDLQLDTIAEFFGYSKYHLHRMFSFITGLPLNTYIKRRKLTEAARALVCTDRPIIDIAMDSGYDTQQSFTNGFKKLYKKSPDRYRKKKSFMPIQLKFQVNDNVDLRGDRVIDIDIKQASPMTMIGYSANTAKGFRVIGQCHHKLNKSMAQIENRVDTEYIIGLNDYKDFVSEDGKISFDYYAALHVSSVKELPEGMGVKQLPAAKYIVFSFIGNKKASPEHVSTYIYEKWFPQTNYRFNENAMYDFIKYSIEENEKGQSKIEYWVPVK